MIVVFCGHSDFQKTEEYEEKLLRILEREVGDKVAEMYLGGYGGFDGFAYYCCKKYKETHPDVSLLLITPYMTLDHQMRYLNTQMAQYDGIIYPEIEDKPLRFAISYRNKWMVEKADLVVAYVTHSFGGAYATYAYAERKGKLIINIADLL